MRRLASLSMMILSIASGALAQAPRTEMRIVAVQGSLPRRALVRALRPERFADCQRTFHGGPLTVGIVVSADGALELTGARGGEEVRHYLPCVRRRLARVRVEPAHAGSRARVVIEFPSLGLGR